MQERIADKTLYDILSHLDGEKDLAQLIRETETRLSVTLHESRIKKYCDLINLLTDSGYFYAVRRTELTRDMLSHAMRQTGIRRGDILLVHSSVSAFGYIKGGAHAMIESIQDVLGPEGTALFPSFTFPFMFIGGKLSKNWMYRPHDPSDYSQIWTGVLPQVLLKEFPEAIRSRHVTHSWAGIGAKAEECLSAHGPTDPPASGNSPMGKALERNGKVLFMGTGLSCNTFLHFIETASHAPFLKPAVCRIKDPDGSLHTVLIEEHLPGDRDFYHYEKPESKFYRKALKAGLRIQEQTLGMNKLYLIGLKELFEIGMQLQRQDPRIMLCDAPDRCFCS